MNVCVCIYIYIEALTFNHPPSLLTPGCNMDPCPWKGLGCCRVLLGLRRVFMGLYRAF